MTNGAKRAAGLLFFFGTVQYILAITVSEAIYSGYITGQQPVSDLGNWSMVGNNAAIFNLSVILLGAFTIAGGYFVQQGFKNRLFTSLIAAIGVSEIAVGLVAENINLPIHSIFALTAFVTSAAAAIMSYKFEKSPLSYVSIILGAITISAIILFILGQGSSDFYLGIGLGGMERFIIYPALLWILGFGGYLIGDTSSP